MSVILTTTVQSMTRSSCFVCVLSICRVWIFNQPINSLSPASVNIYIQEYSDIYSHPLRSAHLLINLSLTHGQWPHYDIHKHIKTIFFYSIMIVYYLCGHCHCRTNDCLHVAVYNELWAEHSGGALFTVGMLGSECFSYKFS